MSTIHLLPQLTTGNHDGSFPHSGIQSNIEGVPQLVSLLGHLVHSPRLVDLDFLLGGENGIY